MLISFSWIDGQQQFYKNCSICVHLPKLKLPQMRILKLFFLLLICFSSRAQTEKNIDHQSLLWTRYVNQLFINEKWSIHTDFDNRIFIDPVKQNTFVFRIQGRYKINKNFEVGGGYAYFHTYTQDPHVTYNFEIPEYRIQQDITWKQNFNRFDLFNRFQIEERFIHNSNKEELLPGTTFYWRLRFRLHGEYTFWKKQNQYLRAIASDEIMINAGKNVAENTFDQNRFYASLQYGATKNIALELGYLNSFQQRASGIDYYDRDIIRFSLYHKINLKRKQKEQTN